jgi:hypothetical protein
MAIGQQVTKPGMGSGAPAPLPSGGMQGTNTSYVQPGSQFSQQNIQRNAQQRVPFQGQFNGNPRGANNMGRRNNNPFGFQGQGMAPAWSQQNNLGRYRPPTMNGMGGYNSNQWNDMGGMDYNLPGSYGSPLGQGQFAPMPQMFQQYLQQMQRGNQPQGGGFGMQMQQMNDLSQFNMGGQGGMGGGDPYYDQMANAYFGNQQPRFGGGVSDPGGWQAGGGSYAPGGSLFNPNPMMLTPDGREVPIGGGLYPDTNFLGGGGSYEDYRNNWQGSNRFADGRTGTMQVISGEDIPLSEEEWRASQGGGAPAGKDGRPLPDPNQAGSVGTDPLSFLRNQTMINNGMAPSFNQRRRGFNRNAETAPQPMEPMPAYDRPENMNYNMAALRQMMGGY